MDNNVVLVTGCNGFTGRYVLYELESSGFEVVQCSADLRDYDALLHLVRQSKPNYVIHLAAMSFVGHRDVNEIYQVNLIGTINLLQALAATNLLLTKVILASSANIYGNTGLEVISEAQEANPANHYGISKHAMELAANQWARELPVLCIRPFNYTGVGQADHFLVPKIVNHFKLKMASIELGNIDVYRDFSDVRDVAKWYVAALNFDKSVQYINFCSGKYTALRGVVEELNRLSGYEIDVKINPSFVRAGEIKKLCGDNSLLAKHNRATESIPINQTLRWMYEA